MGGGGKGGWMWWHGELGGESNATLVLELGVGAVGKLVGGDSRCVIRTLFHS